MRVPSQSGARQEIKAGQPVTELLRRPDMSLSALAEILQASAAPESFELGVKLAGMLADEDLTALDCIMADIKYSGYLQRQQALIERSARLESTPLPNDLDYAKVAGLSREIEEKLSRIRPVNLGQAGRISGVTPAAVACLEIHLHKLGLLKASNSSTSSGQS